MNTYTRRPTSLNGVDSFGAFLLVICTLMLILIFCGWAFMLAVGIASSVGLVGTTIGLWPATAIALLLRLSVAGTASVNKS